MKIKRRELNLLHPKDEQGRHGLVLRSFDLFLSASVQRRRGCRLRLRDEEGQDGGKVAAGVVQASGPDEGADGGDVEVVAGVVQTRRLDEEDEGAGEVVVAGFSCVSLLSPLDSIGKKAEPLALRGPGLYIGRVRVACCSPGFPSSAASSFR